MRPDSSTEVVSCPSTKALVREAWAKAVEKGVNIRLHVNGLSVLVFPHDRYEDAWQRFVQKQRRVLFQLVLCAVVLMFIVSAITLKGELLLSLLFALFAGLFMTVLLGLGLLCEKYFG